MNLDIEKLTVSYGSKNIIEDINLSVKKGSIVTILGTNGSGKSTLLKAIGRLLKVKSGKILLDKRSIYEYKPNEFAQKLAVLSQVHNAASELTVEELIGYGRFPHRKIQVSHNAKDLEVIEHAIKMTRLNSLRKRNINTLSGGERQRAWIAMTLAQEPKVLLLDEPTTFLDICCQFEMIELIKELNHNYNITVVMVLHDLNLAASCSDELVMLKDKQIRYIGKPQEVMTSEILEDIFEINSSIILNEQGVPYCIATGSSRSTEC